VKGRMEMLSVRKNKGRGGCVSCWGCLKKGPDKKRGDLSKKKGGGEADGGRCARRESSFAERRHSRVRHRSEEEKNRG